MYIHETRGRPIMEPYVLFPHTRYTEVYMDRYTPGCACVHTFRSHAHFAAPLTTGGHSR